MFALIAVAVIVAVVAFIYIEGKRQERALGEKASGSPNLVGNAMLEMQGLLEPERKVESMQEMIADEDRVEGEHEQGAGRKKGSDDS